jgi:thioredoxin reductase (NADPH)
MKNFETDLVIIGAGPIGLFSIFEAGMLKINCHVIDSLETIGGQCTALYPEKPIFDIPAHPNILAKDLIAKLEEQAQPFKPKYHLNQRVDGIKKLADSSFIITTSKNNQIKCKAIIIAAGCGAFGPNRPPLDNIEKFEQKSVFYAIREKEHFRDKSIAIAGGGDSAVDWAVNLANMAEKIYVIHRREKFRCAPETLSKMKEIAATGKIELVIPYQLSSLEGDDGVLKNVIVQDFDNNTRSLKADYLLPFFGLAMELGPIANWGLNIEKNHIKVDPSTMQSSESGIYAVGDIATYKNKLKLILSGFAECATAVHDIYKIIHPDAIFHFEYSTSKGIAK